MKPAGDEMRKEGIPMKNLTRKMFSLFLCVTMLLTLAAASSCAEGKMIKIGIIQFATHSSLDNCRTGFIQGLADAGYVEGVNVEFVYQNAQADTGTTALIASQFAETCDMICAIATPAACAAFNACEGKIPVIYTAVSDPVAAGLANADGTNPGEVTGTSDELPVEAQLKMIRALQPDAKKIGILHTTSEANSDSSLATYREIAPKYGFEIVDQGISAGSELSMALDSLLPKVDCTTNLTDNTVVEYLSVVLEKSAEAGKPVYGSEIEQVKAGCVASEGIEYVELGKQTGGMAARVLNGESAATIPFEIISNSFLYISPDALTQYSITVPDDIAERAIDVTK